MSQSNAVPSLDLSAVLNASAENQRKILDAVNAAKEAKKKAAEDNTIKRASGAELIAKINKDTTTALKNEKEAMEKAYRDTLVSLGLDAQAYPMQTAIVAVDDKAFKPAMEVIGKGARIVADAAKGVWSRICVGFKK